MFLTQREEEILKLAVLGLPDKKIAEHLCISVRTVNTHMTRIYCKNGVNNRSEAVAMYLKNVLMLDVSEVC